jgi:hypothetical protein
MAVSTYIENHATSATVGREVLTEITSDLKSKYEIFYQDKHK